MPKFKAGDNVCVVNMSGMDFHGKDAPVGKILEINLPYPEYVKNVKNEAY